ncbi:MAG: UDP-3-O-[3-hydroxymyristoyl] N-acetylglucosamine deacetylase [Deltaproteobacteria bacterium 13_1_20CM_2_69_21]|nr:MAG: UDP-3-O-[3-hydroxymyristoyl] N-acetylglucosamine deacetylase [Deltaproteobacteria bacterium 13_1_40CM_68_24]OLC77155.1 MAG: UDP-3-O-[3-hydroxymyristoyl] N-acetylglucosamine deacetylase [Deltaproteobacteria bacterium 13_1_40CM_4_68_19]OLD08525.1 MAG: UDP-3-O-[3-hydroxymyristoyl] N-acetylglucosamine deacetylase [Deltaproteobacteria bacterium 13_1_40CM_3_69_14]OLD46930.1 MAG: UDP-3-O-[3-hydroxymyristoyl] N-acetylglucosamine deacetylase [Chloroflexi bacterium 13_1_40CM_2_68_14]OLE64059.1 MA
MDLHPFRQRTFKQRAALSGIGLHSGAAVRLTLAPAPIDSGLVFIRDGVEIPARSEFVIDTTLNTSLGRRNVRIGTVEHLLAALAGCGIDNACIEVEGPEVPIADGSAEAFVALVREAGIHEQRATRRYLLVRRTVSVAEGDKLARLSPARGRFAVNYTIDFNHPLISDQNYRLEVNEKSFQKEIARARTFGFKRDVERLLGAGLARGGSLDNAVVVDDFNILNPEGLRYPDEFVRHKILDAMGDLSLFGMPVIGQLTAVKSGHSLNQQLVRKVLAERDACEVVQPSAADELHALQESLLPVLALEEQLA